MSDSNTPNDNAIEVIDEQVRQLEDDIQGHTRRLEVDTAIRDRLLELRATLSRKPRGRKPRLVAEPSTAAAAGVIEPDAKPAAETQAAETPAGWPGFGAPRAAAE